MEKGIVPVNLIERRIYLIRGHKVMLDRDLAELYGVETRVLNQAVRRNKERFPDDFMFPLTREEIMRISQIVISSPSDSASLKYPKKRYGLYRVWDIHAIQRLEQWQSNTGQYPDNAEFRQTSRNDCHQQGAVAEA